MRYVSKGLLALVLAVGATLIITGSALAAWRDQPILCGLWSGANFDLSGHACKDIETSSNTVRNNPSNTPAQPRIKTYAALGDSVAAGLGLPAVANPAGNDARCGRSAQAYPQLIAKQLSVKLVFAACSGATAGDLVTKQHVSGPNITAQLDTAFAHSKPDLITITAGANDMHWLDFIRACYATNCDNTANTAAVDVLLAGLKVKLNYDLLNIDLRSNGTPPPTYLTGYYALGTPSCLAKQAPGRITPAEVAWLNAQTGKLDDTIRVAAANYSFAHYVPIDFGSHGICSKESRRWVQNLNNPAPFHPTPAGQREIANTVLSQIDDAQQPRK